MPDRRYNKECARVIDVVNNFMKPTAGSKLMPIRWGVVIICLALPFWYVVIVHEGVPARMAIVVCAISGIIALGAAALPPGAEGSACSIGPHPRYL